jgi:hypothetical protein
MRGKLTIVTKDWSLRWNAENVVSMGIDHVTTYGDKIYTCTQHTIQACRMKDGRETKIYNLPNEGKVKHMLQVTDKLVIVQHRSATVYNAKVRKLHEHSSDVLQRTLNSCTC